MCNNNKEVEQEENYIDFLQREGIFIEEEEEAERLEQEAKQNFLIQEGFIE